MEFIAIVRNAIVMPLSFFVPGAQKSTKREVRASFAVRFRTAAVRKRTVGQPPVARRPDVA
jgi:hypothetical protein